jgi:hypothetical protein
MKLSRRSYLVLGLVAAPFLMAQSAPSGCTQAQITAAVTTAIGAGCAVAAEINAANINLTSAEQTALTASVAFCPPNPPPTTMTAALQDFVASVPVLLEAYAKANPKKARALRVDYYRAMAKAGQ